MRTGPQTEVDGQLFAADNDPPTPINVGVAIANMMAAYTDAETRPTPDFLDLGGGDIGGLILSPGLYHWDSTVTIPTDVTIQGASDSTWIFQVTGDLDLSSSTDMILEGGAQPAKRASPIRRPPTIRPTPPSCSTAA